jgi:hypothetical protein
MRIDGAESVRVSVKKSVFDPIQFQHTPTPVFSLPSYEASPQSGQPETAKNLKTNLIFSEVLRFQIKRVVGKTV